MRNIFPVSKKSLEKTLTVLSDLDKEYLSGYREKFRKSIGAFLLSTSIVFLNFT